MGERLDGKVALITGAARGQGEAIARLFASEGARVLVTDVLESEGRAVATGLGDKAAWQSLDVRDEQQWTQAVAACTSAFGRLDVLVNNAGIGIPPRRIEDETVEGHRFTLDVNLTGVWNGIRAVMPVMTAQRSGSIVNTSSIDGLVGTAGMASYVASKYAVTGLTRTVALEAGGRGIRVNAVHPGVIETPMVAEAPAEIRARIDRLMARQPIPRTGTPLEIAYAVLFFAGEESSYCTGSSLVVDGGHLAGPWREGFDD
ncbi:MAG TPA: glucose 1-dehydrogenase [Frankiaceae bacterium]|nr:glucose 1-dehydrogenase [Frankiaceae bacterium]